jgi:hypothetical protein
MKFKDIEECKLYQHKDYLNVYTKKNGLLYHMGIITGSLNQQPSLHLDMYYVEYSPSFILDMDFHEIKLIKKEN